MVRNRVRHTALVLSVAACGAALLGAAPAEKKHLHLERSEPMADSTVAAPPTAIRLWFSQPVQLGVTRVHLADAARRPVEVSAPRLGEGRNAPVIVDIGGTVAAGGYTVSWRTMARDGHVVSGSFGFRVAAPATPTR